MESDTVLIIYFSLLILSLAGFGVMLLFYPFEEQPRALLQPPVLLEYGVRDTKTGSVSLTHVLEDGRIVNASTNATRFVLESDELAQLKDAISLGKYVVSRRQYFYVFSQITCLDCQETWLAIRKDDTTIPVAIIQAPRALPGLS